MKTKTITVLGIGNLLYSDEGIGVHILPYLEEQLQGMPVEIVEGSTDGMRLLGTIEESDYLLIVDAVNAGAEPGTICRIEGEDIPAYYGVKMSVHQLGFQEVLFAARLLGCIPEKMVMYGVQPASLEFGLDLSETVQSIIPKLTHTIVRQLEQWA